ncbi:hypothetical protein Sn250709_093 [Synechococcus phage S-RIM2]|jgi:hypothetical protein|uniref:Uncharacterized protein n=4 Tax=Nerrivikvirus srim2 TaxID=2734125 RepID=A0A1D7S360_9CAUD|nr:virion structural protein [Synechococcus phage S-RIM2 R1_1999]AGH06775.1 hypothetical protein SWRG_00081 [Synechococcus phage S-RIM2 R21_2007]AGH06986.1 hypothetical protein SWUG_00076 [Synechococcus phage S-RIM2 R9_2006]AON97606.1 hypothetical protein Fa020709_093 [Synechococcus phage S-RIM2]AGH07196.1 hypothetical protein SWTG_00065 [Synechococcus phage S-RIM2 R1_1999]AON97820.1 hypothetical protein Fa100709_093 [Synechococcus phage S-RIM2]
MTHIPVKDKSNWFRNSETGSLQCADQSEYEKYMTAHRAEQVEKAKMEALQKEVSELKSDMSDIKSLLLTLVHNQK